MNLVGLKKWVWIIAIAVCALLFFPVLGVSGSSTNTDSDFIDSLNPFSESQAYADPTPATSGRAYAVLSTDGTLTFVRSTGSYPNGVSGSLVAVDGTTYNGVRYTNFESTVYTGMNYVPWTANRTKIKKVVFKDYIKPAATAFWFMNCTNLVTVVDAKYLDTSLVTTMNSMFSGCSKLTSVDVSDWDTSLVTNMRFMFNMCQKLSMLDVSHWDTSKVTDMCFLFDNMRSMTTIDVSNFDTGSVTNMGCMFSECHNLKSVDISGFDTSKVQNFSNMFWFCKNLNSVDFSNFDTSSATTLHGLIGNCTKLTTVNMSSFDTTSVTDMGAMFTGCSNLTSLNLSNFETPVLTTTATMFSGATKLESVDISSMDTAHVTSMTNMFSNNPILKQVKLGSSFSFKGNGIAAVADQALLPAPTGSSYTGNWCLEDGSNSMSNTELRDTYDGTTMAGTWVWEETPTYAYAVLGTDGTLSFVRSPNTYTSGSSGTLTARDGTEYEGTIYAGFESASYSSADEVPWSADKASINKVVFKNAVKPLSTAYWFDGCANLTSIEDENALNVSQTTNMAQMFNACSSLSSVKLGPQFSFKGNGITDGAAQAELPTPSGGDFSGKWCHEDGSFAMNSATLRDSYNGATMSGTWVPQILYTVSYDSNGGTGAVGAQTWVTGNDDLTIASNSFSRTNYEFTGWNTSADGSGTPYTEGTSLHPTSTMVLYAQWREVPGGGTDPSGGGTETPGKTDPSDTSNDESASPDSESSAPQAQTMPDTSDNTPMVPLVLTLVGASLVMYRYKRREKFMR